MAITLLRPGKAQKSYAAKLFVTDHGTNPAELHKKPSL